MRNKKIILGIAVFWVAIILIFIAMKESTLQTGTSVILKTQPVDPKDMFRGDYVVLNYEISTIDTDKTYEPGEKVYVELDTIDGYGIVRSIKRDDPEGLFIKGTVQNDFGSSTRVKYGIESYFVPEGEGRALERSRNLEVEVRIDSAGNAVIKDVINDGEIVSFK